MHPNEKYVCLWMEVLWEWRYVIITVLTRDK